MVQIIFSVTYTTYNWKPSIIPVFLRLKLFEPRQYEPYRAGRHTIAIIVARYFAEVSDDEIKKHMTWDVVRSPRNAYWF